MDGGCTSIWFRKPLTFAKKKIIYRYERYLALLGEMKIHSFYWKLKPADSFSRYEQNQFKDYLGSEIEEEMVVCGLADPLFRSVEAIMKFFGGYYIYPIDWQMQEYVRGEYYAIRKRNKVGISVYAYHILDWEFIAAYFNQMDGDDIREVYSLFRCFFH